MEHYSDKELLEKFKGEAPSYAFNLIVRKYQERLYWYIRRVVIDHEDANDVLQNVFLKAWKNLHSFREDANLYTWLYRIATNESLTFLKQKARRQHLSTDELQHQLAGTLESDPHYSGEAIQKKLDQAILTLPEKQRIVFTLKYFEEKKYDEMALILNTSVGALKASYHHAVKKIEKYLTSH